MKSKKVSPVTSVKQGTLFDNEISEGSHDVGLEFRGALSKALAACKDSRWQIAARISEAARRNISKDMLDKYIYSDREYALRAEDLPAVVAVTQNVEPVRVLLTAVGCEVITPDDVPYVRLARLIEQRNRLDREIAQLESSSGIKFKP